jgi:Lon-like ATP-dependent protease
VIEAVEAGTFAVYGVNTVEEALELLTGVPAGERGADGSYPSGSIYGRAAQRLTEMAQAVADWGEAHKGEASKESNKF